MRGLVLGDTKLGILSVFPLLFHRQGIAEKWAASLASSLGADGKSSPV